MSFTSRSTSRWSDVVIASAAQLMGATGAFLVMTTLVLAMQERGASGMQVALLVVAETLPMVVLGKLTGRLADRFDSRWLLIVAGCGQVGAALALASASSYEWMVAGAVALATATAVAQPTRAALLPDMVVRDDLAKASAIGQTAGSIGMMVGPALAGILVGTTAIEHTLRIAAFGFLATVGAGVLLRTRRGGAAAATRQVDAPPPVKWQLRDDRMYWVMVWGMAVVIGLVSAVNVAEVFFVRETLHSSATVYGIVGSGWTVGMLVGAWVMTRLIRPLTMDGTIVRWMFLSLGGLSAMVMLCGTVQAALWIIPCWLVGGLLNGGENVMAGTLLGRRVPREARGRAAAAMQSRVQGGGLLGFIAGGAMLDLFDARWIVFGAGLLGLIGVLLVTPIVRRVSAGSLTPSASQQSPEPEPAIA